VAQGSVERCGSCILGLWVLPRELIQNQLGESRRGVNIFYANSLSRKVVSGFSGDTNHLMQHSGERRASSYRTIGQFKGEANALLKADSPGGASFPPWGLRVDWHPEFLLAQPFLPSDLTLSISPR